LSALGCVLGEIIIPLLLGVLSALYLFDNNKRVFSILISLAVIALNVVSILFGYAISLFAPAAVVLSVILFLSFKGEQSKSDTAYIMTIISAAFSVISYLLFAMIQQGAFTLDAAIEYYSTLLEEFRIVFVDAVIELYTASGVSLTTESVSELFSNQLSMIISYLLIGGFAITGVGMKIFGVIVGCCLEDKTPIKKWRFAATRLYGYFYLILVIISIFVISKDSLFAITVLNLYNIFMIVFAYIGFKVALDIMKRRRNPIVSAIILIVSIIIFASFAAQMLAALGVLYTLRRNDLEAKPQ
jgi:hypothetical protein